MGMEGMNPKRFLQAKARGGILRDTKPASFSLPGAFFWHLLQFPSLRAMGCWWQYPAKKYCGWVRKARGWKAGGQTWVSPGSAAAALGNGDQSFLHKLEHLLEIMQG